MAAAYPVALLALLVAGSTLHAQASTAEDPHYVAAVVDYAAPLATGLRAEENMMRNIEALDELMSRASEQGADILVFPESGLHGFDNECMPLDVPAPDDRVIPCNVTENAAKPLRELSCLAVRHNMYLAVNLVHRVNCTRLQSPDCPARGAFHYNTEVVFDRSGEIVARYHKNHLYDESHISVPPSVEYAVFDTDFGVRFGVFICIDIFFDKPAAHLARERGVTDFIFSAAWFSHVPFATAVQVHSGWAHALDVTLLSAGYNYPKFGVTGSGIYRGRQGVLNATVNWRAKSTLLVHRVPKRAYWGESLLQDKRGLESLDPVLNYGASKDPFEEVLNIKVQWDNMTAFSTLLLPRPALGVVVKGDETLCHNGFCCQLQYEAQGVALFQRSGAAASMRGGFSSSRRNRTDDYNKRKAEGEFDGFYYRLAAYNGLLGVSNDDKMGIQVCGVVSCLSEAVQSCGWNAPGLGSPSIKWTEFRSLDLDAEFDTDGTLQFPSTLAGPRYEPLPPVAFSFDSHDFRGLQPDLFSDLSLMNSHRVKMSLKQPLLDVRTFAIYGRVFSETAKNRLIQSVGF